MADLMLSTAPLEDTLRASIGHVMRVSSLRAKLLEQLVGLLPAKHASVPLDDDGTACMINDIVSPLADVVLFSSQNRATAHLLHEMHSAVGYQGATEQLQSLYSFLAYALSQQYQRVLAHDKDALVSLVHMLNLLLFAFHDGDSEALLRSGVVVQLADVLRNLTALVFQPPGSSSSSVTAVLSEDERNFVEQQVLSVGWTALQHVTAFCSTDSIATAPAASGSGMVIRAESESAAVDALVTAPLNNSHYLLAKALAPRLHAMFMSGFRWLQYAGERLYSKDTAVPARVAPYEAVRTHIEPKLGGSFWSHIESL